KTMNPQTEKVINVIGEMQEVYRLLEQRNFAGGVTMIFEIIGQLAPQVDTLKFTRIELQQQLLKERLKIYRDVMNKLTDPDVQSKFGYVTSSDLDSIYIFPGTLLSFLFESKEHQAINVIKKSAGFFNDVVYTQNSKEL